LHGSVAWDVNIFVDFAGILIFLAGKVVIAQQNVPLQMFILKHCRKMA